jgi:hypothetical protein
VSRRQHGKTRLVLKRALDKRHARFAPIRDVSRLGLLRSKADYAVRFAA